MPTPAGDASVDLLLTKEQIASLAVLYDRFANALDPFAPERDEAEAVFLHEIASLYDLLRESGNKSVTYQDFRKAVIVRCRRHLSANDKPPSV